MRLNSPFKLSGTFLCVCVRACAEGTHFPCDISQMYNKYLSTHYTCAATRSEPVNSCGEFNVRGLNFPRIPPFTARQRAPGRKERSLPGPVHGGARAREPTVEPRAASRHTSVGHGAATLQNPVPVRRRTFARPAGDWPRRAKCATVWRKSAPLPTGGWRDASRC